MCSRGLSRAARSRRLVDGRWRSPCWQLEGSSSHLITSESDRLRSGGVINSEVEALSCVGRRTASARTACPLSAVTVAECGATTSTTNARLTGTLVDCRPCQHSQSQLSRRLLPQRSPVMLWAGVSGLDVAQPPSDRKHCARRCLAFRDLRRPASCCPRQCGQDGFGRPTRARRFDRSHASGPRRTAIDTRYSHVQSQVRFVTLPLLLSTCAGDRCR